MTAPIGLGPITADDQAHNVKHARALSFTLLQLARLTHPAPAGSAARSGVRVSVRGLGIRDDDRRYLKELVRDGLADVHPGYQRRHYYGLTLKGREVARQLFGEAMLAQIIDGVIVSPPRVTT